MNWGPDRHLRDLRPKFYRKSPTIPLYTYQKSPPTHTLNQLPKSTTQSPSLLSLPLAGAALSFRLLFCPRLLRVCYDTLTPRVSFTFLFCTFGFCSSVVWLLRIPYDFVQLTFTLRETNKMEKNGFNSLSLSLSLIVGTKGSFTVYLFAFIKLVFWSDSNMKDLILAEIWTTRAKLLCNELPAACLFLLFGHTFKNQSFHC